MYPSVVEMIQRLRDAGQTDAAALLEEFQGTFFTISSEWWGELGLTLRRIEQEFQLNEKLHRDLTQMISSVHNVWPDL
jgi:hypothetical protein